MPALTQFPNSPAPAQDFVQTPSYFPAVPDEIINRFPAASEWNADIIKWYKQLAGAIGDANDSVSSVANANSQAIGDVVIKQGDLTLAITTETNARITADEELAQRIVTVSALAGASSHISVQNSPPGGPALNDLWVNNSDPAQPVTYEWDGANWVEVTQPISVAAVAAEQTARISADGFLSGKFTLTVIAGNVVTGMNITSSTGTGTNVSSVIFRATDFQIYNGVSGITMFSVSGSNVNLAGVLTVSTSGKVFTGTGSYGNSNTPFYVDSTSHFSLGSNLTWDGSTLTITGSISATTGTIGGWSVSSTTLSRNNAVLDSAGQLILGTVNDVVYLSATNATYRIWAGNAAAGSASFSVTKTGALFSNSGMIGGFTIGSTLLEAGSGATYIKIDNSVPLILFGSGANQIASYRFDGIQTLNSASQLTIDLFNHPGGYGYFRLLNAGTAALTVDSSTGGLTLTGTAVASLFSGSGASLTSLSASNISSGTLNTARLPSPIQISAGSAGSPAYSFSGATGDGWWSNGSGDMRAATNGSTRFVIRDAAIVILVPLKLDNSFAGGAPAATGYVTVQDATGTTYKLLAAP